MPFHALPVWLLAAEQARRAPHFRAAMAIDLSIFALTYTGIAVGHIPGLKTDRSAIALLGAIALLLAQRLSFSQATGWINWPTLALLFGLMMISAQLFLAGFYSWVIQKVLQLDGKPWATLIAIVVVAAVLSALFANDIVCLVFTPVLCVAMQRSGRDPVPYLIAMVTGSNIGSAATLIGNPQNMLIGQTAHLAFGHFVLVAAPLVAVCLALDILLVALVYRKQIFGANNREHAAPEAAPPPAADPAGGAQGQDHQPVTEWPQITKTLVIMAALLVLFVVGRDFGLHRDVAAIAAAGLLLLTRKHAPDELIMRVNWKLILLFIGLFVVIGDMRQHALLALGLHGLQHAGIHLVAPWPLAAITVALSNLASNVPAVLLLMPGLHGASGHLDWYLLAVVSTFAGNLCLLGSIANIIVAEQARGQKVKMRFLEFSKVGVPLALVTCAAAVLYLQWVR